MTTSVSSAIVQMKPIQQAYIKKTHSNRIYRLSHSRYLRNDLPHYLDELLSVNIKDMNVANPTSTQENKDSRSISIIFPSYALMRHQIDFLENHQLKNVIFIQTLYQQISKENNSLFSRLRKVVYTGKERNIFLFENEFCLQTFDKEVHDAKLPLVKKQMKKVVSVLRYYKNLLEEKKPPEIEVKLVYLMDVSEIGSTDSEIEELKSLQELSNGFVQIANVVEYLKKATKQNLPLSILDILNTANQEEIESSSDKTQGSSAELYFSPHISLKEISEGIENGTIFHGALRMQRSNINQGTVEVSANVGTEINPSHSILIPTFKSINRAIDGDIVAVRLLPRSKWTAPNSRVQTHIQLKSQSDSSNPNVKPTGEIVGIIKRNWRAYCGSIDENAEIGPGPRNVFFIPVLPNIPKIKIRTRQSEELFTKRIQVAIDNWPPNSMYPIGHYVATLGEIGDMATESEVVLIEHDIPHYSFPQNVLDCLPPDDWYITPEELGKRRDIRHYPVCSVDPPNCKDIDDALHAFKLENGNYHIGVHIADVSHFVQEGTALDFEAANRSTSVYLVEKRIDMLPKILTEDLCSLKSNVPRLAFSCMWEITPDAKIVNTEFCKTVIFSKASLTYQEAQLIIEDRANNSETANSLRILRDISKILRQRRFDNGALALASPQVKFNLDTETLNPTDVSMYEIKETNSMIEEFMLLANVAVAEFIEKSFSSTAILRLHPSPDPSNFETLQKSLNTWGLQLDTSNSANLSSSLDKISIPGNEYVNTLTRILTTRCMQQAKYFPSGTRSYSEYWHYGLAIPIYTHFTSPIRRYADILVHRLLGCAIGVYPITENVGDGNRLQAICHNMNYRTRQADYAGRSSVSLYTIFFFANRTVEEEAYVLSVKPNAISYFVPRYGFEHMTFIEEDDWIYDSEKETVTHKQNQRKIRIFEKIHVRISVQTTKHHRRKLVGEILEETLQSSQHGAISQKEKNKSSESSGIKRKRDDSIHGEKRLRIE